jgi:NAD(P)-dependent dehydrogenase (short-subunit alcohol dehydrogenase family)
MDMAKKAAVVTGAHQGIGLATARRLAADDIHVVLADILDSEAEASAIRSRGGSAIALTTDVRDETAVADLVVQTVDRFGRLDILVNNAAVFEPGLVPDESLEKWDWTVDTNLKGPFLCSKHAVPAMRRTGGGVIINIGSEYGVKAGPRRAIYAATKGGLNQLTKAMAVDHAVDGIRVNCVCPGPILTPLLEKVIDEAADPEAMREAEIGSTIVRRFGTLDEISAVIAFLCSDQASFVTGAIIAADGGVTTI